MLLSGIVRSFVENNADKIVYKENADIFGAQAGGI
jgi:L-serine deaminase